MSVLRIEFEEEEFEKYYTVFDGSSQDDVSHAKLLWNSLSLLPPQESRLESSDIHQRLPVARSRKDTTSAISKSIAELKVPPQKSRQRLQLTLAQSQEERKKYLGMANQRGEILDLLMKQKGQRIQKEMASRPYKPKQRDGFKSVGNYATTFSKDLDIEEVKLLQ
ncbi:cilia- and flagella-associated protein HOATZ [Hypomesus transpacificus]|uniref:cilia- and flagella-associated protein HOATZ n=1 Tax=Hypomesus transpacificus TaxID=137520 RepID=UPI001F078BC1|nr:cilia- and flagella-associated protein HOATZ [Hypomesus transpacificus]